MPTESQYLTTQSADGTEIGYYVQGQGPALVITHGSVGTAEDWRGTTAALENDFTCYVYDRRGRAHSGDGNSYSMESEIADIAALMNIAGPGASLLGHSYGGLCVLEYAQRHTIPGTLFLFEPPLPMHGPVAGPRLEDYRDAIAAGDNEKAIEIALVNFVELPAEAIPHVRSTPLWESIVPLAPTWTRELEQIDALGANTDRFSALSGRPTHVIAGTSTTGFLLESAHLLNRVIVDSTITELPGLDHFAHIVDPQAFAQAVRQGHKG
ncbi:alpha/beta fold hydrolase [Brevibacterium atlanticum]|uniref:alpha/beta fold hydrolase n=1 Tax=Brevibacterium atlanticum TaxID=2697563 RepID=UPI00141F3C9C|nr:alpha/beta hydrolase [Brevibacterium atlanticum]